MSIITENNLIINDEKLTNANLRCAEIFSLNLNDINFSYAKLNFALFEPNKLE